MFKVFLDGVYRSKHRTFAEACRHARMESERHRQSYFTVFEAGEDIDNSYKTTSETLCGVPDYIITPNEGIASGAISVSTASSLLKVRLPSHMFVNHDYPLI